MSDIANRADQPRPAALVTQMCARLLAWRPRIAVYGAVALAALAGWLYLAAMVAAMLPAMDMGELGPGMRIFNLLGGFADMPAEVRASLAALCLPGYSRSFGMAGGGSWDIGDLTLVYVMWVMMVLAMMLPSAAPMLARYSERLPKSRATPAVLRMAAGYLTVWCVYSLIATGLQWALHEAQLATVMMAPVTTSLAATTLIAAGLYQFTPLKRACLTRCQTPYPTLDAPLNPETGESAYRAGLRQGLDCMGCCWALMAVMFAVGVMNILWIAVLGIVMVVEKTRPQRWISPVIGVVLVLWGAALLTAIVPIPSVF